MRGGRGVGLRMSFQDGEDSTLPGPRYDIPRPRNLNVERHSEHDHHISP
jgi:hypothetical protein